MADMTAATMVGVRLSLATAVVAGAVAAQQDVPWESATWAGVQLVHLIFGAIGAAITLASVEGWGWFRVASTLVCGLGAAALGTPYAMHYLPPPPELRTIGGSLYATLLGVVGVFLMPGAINAARSFAANPFALIDWWRGRGPAPVVPPATDQKNPGEGGGA